MSPTIANPPPRAQATSDVLAKLEALLALLGQIEATHLDLTTPDGFRSAIEFVAQLAELAGADTTTIDNLKADLEDPAVLALGSAIAKFIEARLPTSAPPATSPASPATTTAATAAAASTLSD